MVELQLRLNPLQTWREVSSDHLFSYRLRLWALPNMDDWWRELERFYYEDIDFYLSLKYHQVGHFYVPCQVDAMVRAP